MNKILIFLLKYIPIIQMMGIFINNIFYLFNIINDYIYIIDFIIGNSLITTFLLLLCGHIFKFCNWHKYIIITNFINILIANIDAICYINISNIEMFVIINLINVVGITLSLYNKFIKHYE